jgi:hypothetical protein
MSSLPKEAIDGEWTKDTLYMFHLIQVSIEWIPPLDSKTLESSCAAIESMKILKLYKVRYLL